VADAVVRKCEGVAAARVASTSTPGAHSKATTDGRLGVNVAGNGRVLLADVFKDAQDLASTVV